MNTYHVDREGNFVGRKLKTFFVTCPECHGNRLLDHRTLCWRCNGEGRLEIPDIGEIARPERGRLAVIVVLLLACILGGIGLVVGLKP